MERELGRCEEVVEQGVGGVLDLRWDGVEGGSGRCRGGRQARRGGFTREVQYF